MNANNARSLKYGLLYGVLTTVLLVSVNTLAKHTSEYHHQVQIVFFRHIISASLLILIALVMRNTQLLRPKRIRPHLLRGFFGTLTMLLLFLSLEHLPLTETTSIFMVSPIFVMICSWPILREKITTLRATCVMAGLIGVWVMMQPSAVSSMTGAWYALGAAASGCGVVLSLRVAGRHDHAMTTTFLMALIGLILSSPVVIFFWTAPSVTSLILMVSIGACATLLQYCQSKQYQNMPASLGSAMLYLTIVWSLLVDLMIWGAVPQPLILVGAAVVTAANLIPVYLETRKQKNAAP